MVMWVFGYGSLIWKAGFHYDNCLVGFIKDYRRVFHQGSTDHRGTPEYPGRTVTLEPADGEVCWGVAYKISKKEDEEIALTISLLVLGERLSKLIDEDRAKIRFKSCLSCNNPRKPLCASCKLSLAAKYLEVREKQYDKKAYLDFFTDPTGTTPAISGVMVYIASPDKKLNKNYLGPASLEEIAKQIIHAKGPSGPNREYLFQLEKALLELGCKDGHVMDLANEVRRILSERELTA